MKKVCIFVLVMILLAVPCGAVQQETVTTLQFCTPETVYGISAIYKAVTEDVTDITVVFVDAIKAYAYANYVNDELRIIVASAEPIDLTGEIGEIVATLGDGTTITPELQIKNLKYNGKAAVFMICDDNDKDHACDKCGRYMGIHEVVVNGHCCTYCGQTMTDCSDFGKDHTCDICGAAVGTHEAAAGKHICEYCGEAVSQCEDNNRDHLCDVCGKNNMGTHADAADDTDHVCDYGCGAKLENCFDKVDDDDHKCDICGAENVTDHSYGDWITTDTTSHWKTCSCGMKAEEGTHVYDNDRDAVCNTCGYERILAHEHTFANKLSYDANNHWYASTCGHTLTLGMEAHHGGTATCVAQAACVDCGQVYGEKDDSNHTKQNTTVKDAVEASCGATGYTGDTYCECGVKITSGKIIPATGEHVDGEDTNHSCDICGAENVTEHSYGDWISTDEESHWKVCSCGLKAEVGLHIYTDAEDTACNICGHERVIAHEHTFATSLSYDETNHWYASTCGHNVTSGLEVHQWSGGICSVCQYNCDHAYGSAAFDWQADYSSAKVTVICDRCGNQQILNCEISSQWNAEADTLTFTATAGGTYTDTQIIKLTMEGGKLTVTMSTLGTADAANMIIMIAGYSANGQMSGCQVVKEVTGMTEKILTVTGDTIKVFFLKFGTYAPLFECVEP